MSTRPELRALKRITPAQGWAAILTVSAAILGALIAIVYGHGRAEAAPQWVAFLPATNAALNATSAVLLLLAFRVRHTNTALHARRMLAALCASALFLLSYVVYHSIHGDTRFAGRGAIRPFYFFVLVSHVGLSSVAVPIVFASFFFGLSGRIRQHRRIVRFAFPVWVYVSVTGVLVYALLRVYS
jgi:putative membrane protein